MNNSIGTQPIGNAGSNPVPSTHTKLKLMKKNKKNIQMPVPDKSGVCATCFFKFHDRTSETGFYCIKNHEEVLANGNC